MNFTTEFGYASGKRAQVKKNSSNLIIELQSSTMNRSDKAVVDMSFPFSCQANKRNEHFCLRNEGGQLLYRQYAPSTPST